MSAFDNLLSLAIIILIFLWGYTAFRQQKLGDTIVEIKEAIQEIKTGEE